MIKRINKAFYRSYSKRSQNAVLLLIPIIFITAAQIAMFVEDKTIVIVTTCVCTMIIVFARRILLSRTSYVQKKIVHALHDANQSDIFFDSIENEMQHPSLQTYAENGNQIYIFVTENWLILTSPNGCLICKVRDIKDISVDFQESRSKFRLKMDFFDGGSFFCAYEHLYEPLVELINKSRGVVS